MLYSQLLNYGSFIPLNSRINGTKFIDWTEENFEYVQYNPRKKIDRQGLSITSLDGGVSGVPDLDSLTEYNKEHNMQIEERDFTIPTPVYYDSPDLRKFLLPYQPWMFRTHVLKLNPGGYFPKHRDYYKNNFHHVRLIAALKNPCTFVMEGKALNFEPNVLYFLDTAKEHELFNSTSKPSYWLVVNYELTQESFDVLFEQFRVK